jgi:hypothetical protein
MAFSEWRICCSRHGFSKEVARKCETQYAIKDIFNVNKTTRFYNAKSKITPALKGEKCQGGKWYKDCVTVLLCCNADDSKKLHPLIVGRSEKPHCLKGLRH